jgi:hypothetical protein
MKAGFTQALNSNSAVYHSSVWDTTSFSHYGKREPDNEYYTGALPSMEDVFGKHRLGLPGHATLFGMP